MHDLVRDSVARWRRAEGRPDPARERIVSFDVTRGVVDGTCYLVFEGALEQPAVVAKLARTDAGRRIFLTEFETLRKLDAIGMNERRLTTPRPLDLIDRDGVLVTLQSAMPGTLMKNLPGRRLFSPEGIDGTVGGVIGWWREFQERFGVRRERLVGESWESAVADPVRRFTSRFIVDPEESRFLEARYLVERRLEGVELPLMARHGDFCTANMTVSDDGVGVFDWEFPLRHELPLFDLFLFFASTRFPHTGRQGESGHFDSFVQVYWGENRVNAALRRTVKDVCERFDLPPDAVEDLFVLALIEIANMKYDGLLEGSGAGADSTGGAVSDRSKRERWAAFESPDKDAPFACIEQGVFENLRQVVRRGSPGLS